MPRKLNLNSYLYEKAFNCPLLIEPGKARVLANYLEQRFEMPNAQPKMNHDHKIEDEGETKIFANVAVIPILGTLINRAGMMEAESGILSHRGIRTELLKAADDSKIDTILLDIDSGGGEVEGNFSLGRLIRRINDEVKPVVAIANGSAFSGAFSLGVSAGSFFVTETGGVGSVGVVIQHVDFSKNNEMNGIVVSNITFGKRKAELSPDFPLSEEARQLLEDEANRIGELFVAHVAQMRGISEEVIKDTEASLIFGQDAVIIGFVDGIVSFDDLIDSLVSAEFPVSPTQATMRIKEMFVKKKAEAKPDPKKVEDEKPEGDGGGEDTSTETSTETDQETSGTDDAANAANQSGEEDPVEKAAQITEICTKAGMPDKAAAYIRLGKSIEEVTDEMDRAGNIQSVCTLAGKPDRASAFISSGKSLKQVQDELVTEMADEQEAKKISNTKSPEAAAEDVDTARNVVLEDAERRKKEFANSK